MAKQKIKLPGKYKITVIETLEEIYPETGRRLIRPNISVWKGILVFFLYIIGAGLLAYGVNKGMAMLIAPEKLWLNFGWRFALLYIALLLLLFFLKLKSMVIFAIRVYQKYGSYEIRCRCLFVPNCSEYMILAIKKYGVFRGVKKGFARFKRCYGSNGGEDYP